MSEPQSLWTNSEPPLHVVSWGGEGTPLLLLHGMAGNTHWWDGAAAKLAFSFATFALDFHGHGESAWLEDGGYGEAAYVADVEAARHALGLPRVVLAAHSLGARVALAYARKHPERVQALVAIDFLTERYVSKSREYLSGRRHPQPVYPDVELILRNFRLQPPGTALSEARLKELGRHCVRQTPEGWTWKFDWRAFLQTYEPVWDGLSGLRVPTLVVRGAESSLMSREQLERVRSLIPGAKSLEIPGAHHHVPLDAPAETAAAIADFAPCSSAA